MPTFRSIVIVLLTLLTTACGTARQQTREPEDGVKPGGEALAGDIRVDGSSTVLPVSELAAEQFRARQPRVDVSVGSSGTGGGFKKFCNGEIDIADASRPIEDDERKACQQAGLQFTELLIGLDGITNAVNSHNDFVACLTVDQLEAIWKQGSKIDNWREVDPSFPDRKLVLFGPGPDSGTFDFFVEEVLGEGGQPRRDYTASEDDNVLVQGIAGDDNAFGYFGFAYFEANHERLKAVALDGGKGCVQTSAETVNNGQYPLSRPLFIYVRDESLQQPHVRAFVEFYVGKAAKLVTEAGYVAPPEQTLDEQRRKLDQASSPSDQ